VYGEEILRKVYFIVVKLVSLQYKFSIFFSHYMSQRSNCTVIPISYTTCKTRMHHLCIQNWIELSIEKMVQDMVSKTRRKNTPFLRIIYDNFSISSMLIISVGNITKHM